MPVHREKVTPVSRGRDGTVRTGRESGRETQSQRTAKRDSERVIIMQTKARKPEEKKESKGSKKEKQPIKEEMGRLRTRTRTLSPTEVKQLIPRKVEQEATAPTPNEEFTAADEYEYEDDFEEYESDFESDESEKQRDQKETSDIPAKQEIQKQMSAKQRREIDEIKLAMQKENDLRKLSDEKIQIEIQRPTAEEKIHCDRKATSRKRGDDLLGMITLDTIFYSFLEIPSVSYDVYMRTYGSATAKQVHVQTNEDNLEEETQTDEVETCNKWVQKPPGGWGSQRPTTEERLGVGGDDSKELAPTLTAVDTTRLTEFLINACQLILPALKNGSQLQVGDKSGLVFSDGFVPLNVSGLPFLQEKSVTDVCYGYNGSILSVHSDPAKFGESFICEWNMNDPSTPVKVLSASNRITSICSAMMLVFGGFADGTVCLWDLKEPSALHQSTTHLESGWVLRSPTYTTAPSAGHISPVVSVKILQELDVSHQREFTPIQVCTLEEAGTIIIWSVVQGRMLLSTEDVGLAHWGRVKLVKNSTFSIADGLDYASCTDLALSESEIYVTTSTGNIQHLSRYGTATKPKFFGASDEASLSEATCLEMCPFSVDYFLAGCRDGSIRLHYRKQENPLISLNGNVSDDEPQASILSLSWLRIRPFVFFALDALSRIHIWDLGLSDMYPETILDLSSKKITCVGILQADEPLFVLGTASGQVEVHRLKESYVSRPSSEVNKDIKKFLKYVSILDDLDEVLILESKVVVALARLQKCSYNGADSDGVDHAAIVEFLSSRCLNLDGDIESQVITALQSGIRKGFICGLSNGNYSLVGVSPHMMIAQCYNNIYHGPQCTCSTMMAGRRFCCSFRLGSQSDFVKRRRTTSGWKKRSGQCLKASRTCIKCGKKKRMHNCS